MAVKKAKKFSLKKYIIIGGVIVAIGIGGVAIGHNAIDNKHDYDNSTTSVSDGINAGNTSTTEIDNDTINAVEKTYDFVEVESSYEYPSNTELNNIIDSIKGVNFNTPDGYFYNYNVEKMVGEELDAIKNSSKTYKVKIDSTSYDWYKNGEVDCNLLNERILNNSKEKNISIDSNQKGIAWQFCVNLQKCIDYIKSKAPTYDFSIPLYNIDNLTVENISNVGYTTWYDYTKNNLEVDYNDLSNDEIAYNITFQIFQLLENQSIANGEIYMTSFNIDSASTSATPIFWDFVVQSISVEAVDNIFGGQSDNFVDETDKVNLVAKATGSDYQVINRLFLQSDQEGLIKLFEPEMQDSKTVFTILELLDISCGYGSVPDGCDEVSFRSNAGAKARLMLLQNYYIKMIKEVKEKGMAVDIAEEKILEMKQTILNERYSNYNMSLDTEDELYKSVEELDEELYKLKYSK